MAACKPKPDHPAVLVAGNKNPDCLKKVNPCHQENTTGGVVKNKSDVVMGNAGGRISN